MAEEDEARRWVELALEVVRTIAVVTLLVLGWSERIEAAKSVAKDPEKTTLQKIRGILIGLI